MPSEGPSGYVFAPSPARIATRHAPSASLTGDHVVVDLRDTTYRHPPVDPTDLEPYLQARRLTSAQDILEARRLHAAVYVDRGFVAEHETGDDGTLVPEVDPWPSMSTYFAIRRKSGIVATARQIHPPELDRLPAIGLSDRRAHQTRAVLQCAPHEVVEISGLARSYVSTRFDAVALYVSMWRHSMAAGHRAWVMAVDPPLFVQLREMICGEAIKPLGPRRAYMGGNLVTAAVFLDEASGEHRRLARERADRWPVCGLLPHLFVPWADSPLSVCV